MSETNIVGEKRQRKLRSQRWLGGLGRCLISWLITPAVFAVALYATEYYHCSRFTPTGDALFDRYARVVIRRQAPRLWYQRPRDFLTTQAHVPDAELARWEGEFGGDPRYWHLRYWNTDGDESKAIRLEQVPAWRISEFNDGSPQDLLIAGYQRGAKDWILVTLIARTAQRTMYDALDARQSEFGESGTEEFKARFGAAQRKLEGEVQALLDEAIALAPDQAWPYYERALYWMDLGEYELAEADFAAGNQAPEVVYPCLFPESAVRERLNETNYRENGAVNGAILHNLEQSNVWPWLILKSHAQELMIASELQGATSLNTEFHRFICRAAAAKQTPDQLPQLLLAVAGLLDEYYVTTHAELSTDERRVLLLEVTSIKQATLLTNLQAAEAELTCCCVLTIMPEVRQNPLLATAQDDLVDPYNPQFVKRQRFNPRCYFKREYYEDHARVVMIWNQLNEQQLEPIAWRLSQLDFANINDYNEKYGHP
jgi:hypothetical protein